MRFLSSGQLMDVEGTLHYLHEDYAPAHLIEAINAIHDARVAT